MCLCKIEMAVLTFTATSVLSVVNLKSMARVDKHIDAALLLIEPDMPFFTHSTANLFDTTQITLSNTLPST